MREPADRAHHRGCDRGRSRGGPRPGDHSDRRDDSVAAAHLRADQPARPPADRCRPGNGVASPRTPAGSHALLWWKEACGDSSSLSPPISVRSGGSSPSRGCAALSRLRCTRDHDRSLGAPLEFCRGPFRRPPIGVVVDRRDRHRARRRRGGSDRRLSPRRARRPRRSRVAGAVERTDVGGRGGSLADAAEIVEQIAAACGSTAMVVLMHYAAVAVLEAHGPKEVRRDDRRAVRTVTSLAFSESGSRSHFWAPMSTATAVGRRRPPGRDEELGHLGRRGRQLRLVEPAGRRRRADDAVAGARRRRRPARRGAVRRPGTARQRVEPGAGGRRRGACRRRVLGDGRRRAGHRARRGAAGVPGPQRGLLARPDGGHGRRGRRPPDLDAPRHLGRRWPSSRSTRPSTRGCARGPTRRARSSPTPSPRWGRARRTPRCGCCRSRRSRPRPRPRSPTAVMRLCGGAAFRKELGVERRFRDALAARVMAPTTDGAARLRRPGDAGPAAVRGRR